MFCKNVETVEYLVKKGECFLHTALEGPLEGSERSLQSRLKKGGLHQLPKHFKLKLPCVRLYVWAQEKKYTYMTYVLLVDLTPPMGILLMMTEEFFGMSAPSSVYSTETDQMSTHSIILTTSEKIVTEKQ